MSTTAVVIGRWQIFHKGHETLLKAALSTAERVIVVIGSAFRSRNPNNPFNWEERQAMIESTLSASEKSRFTFVPIRDYFDDVKWAGAVTAAVAKVKREHGATTLISFKKDDSGYYQDNFPEWAKLTVTQEHDINATALRDVFFEGSDPDARLAVLAPYVNNGVLNYLQAWARLPLYAARVAEHKAVNDYRAKWGQGPFLTADAVVTVTVNNVQYVLLVQRKGDGLDCGAGLWGVPGGFLDPGERHYDAALRELWEETGLKLLPSTMRHALKSVQMFDHPGRSARARLITQAHEFSLGHQVALPEVHASSEVLAVKWAAVPELGQYVGNMLDDHDVVLDHFVGFFPAD